jgi:hypothetical protein
MNKPRDAYFYIKDFGFWHRDLETGRAIAYDFRGGGFLCDQDAEAFYDRLEEEHARLNGEDQIAISPPKKGG